VEHCLCPSQYAVDCEAKVWLISGREKRTWRLLFIVGQRDASSPPIADDNGNVVVVISSVEIV